MTELEYELPKEQRMYRRDIYGSGISRVCEPRDTSHVTTKPHYMRPTLTGARPLSTNISKTLLIQPNNPLI